MESKKGHFLYTDSYYESHHIPFLINEYNSVMELISDRCIEDWGDCKGRAWCATCHVSIQTATPMGTAETHRLGQLSNRTTHSRLACQIPLAKLLEAQHIQYIGDD